MHTPDSNIPVSGLEPPVAVEHEPRSVDAVLSAMSSALSSGNATEAAALLQEAATDHPAEAILGPAIAKCKVLVNRTEWVDAALKSMAQDLADDHFVAGLGHIRKALNLSHGFPALRSQTDQQAARQARKLLPQNWRVAESILAEAASTEPSFIPDGGLRELLRSARHDELISNAIHQADRSEFDGKRDQARQRLTELLAAYPGEVRLQQRLQALDKLPPPASEEAEQRLTKTSYKATPVVPIEANPTNATTEASAPPPVKLWRTKVLIPGAAWNNVKNFGATAVATAMLGIAGFLVWQHFGAGQRTAAQAPATPTRPRSPLPTPVTPMPVAVVEKATAPLDDQAWELVKTSNDVASIESFLASYPLSTHTMRAKLRLASVEWERVDKANPQALKAYIQSNPAGPYKIEAQQRLASSQAKDADQEAILKIVRLYRLNDPATAEQARTDIFEVPVIAGDDATLRCRPRNPPGATPVLFAFAKRDGVWKIESVH